ncbi:MAG TPA: MBL fold metallo-hydrolase [Steroidobacteraceae bacterium]|nr:MBL fold metallo-hydrolase [Steroidobacteraceae bacterium]
MIDTQFLGHACLKFSGFRGALLCDPWLTTVPIYGNTAVKYPFLPHDQLHAALQASHVYVSHHHEDHFHIPTLDLFERDTTLLIPAFEYVRHTRAQSMLRTLERLGFRNVVALKSWETIELDLGEPLRLTLIPSAQSRWHDWENSGLILQSADWSALNLNDNLVDDPLLEEIRLRAGRPDAVFVQGFPSTEFPGSFDFSIREKIRIGRHKRGNVEQAELVIRKLAPRSVTPIACDIAWHRRTDLYRNYSDKPTPSQFGAILEKRGLLAQTRYVELGPADSFDVARLKARRPYGTLNYAGFRRRLRRKMLRFERLVNAYDAYVERRGFDARDLACLLADLRAYFPAVFPVSATVRIDFLIVDSAGATLARISFCVRGAEFTIGADEESGLPCDQEIIVPEPIWLETLGGRLLRRDLFNLCVNRQIKPFKPAVAWLRYFINYYFDFGDISPWVRISGRQPSTDNLPDMRSMRTGLAPRFSASELRDEYAEAPVSRIAHTTVLNSKCKSMS